MTIAVLLWLLAGSLWTINTVGGILNDSPAFTAVSALAAGGSFAMAGMTLAGAFS